ncbi:helix-turn-helix protein [anaerobic digester metagenome]
MTIGEKIKYFREKIGLTQNTLAAAAQLHPVSIRKYETNKMQPQPPQIKKIADVLNISPNTLIGLENSNLRLETVGDFMSILCMLLETKQLTIEGDRKEDGFLKPDTLYIQVNNPFIKNQLVNWERMNYLYNQIVTGKEDVSDDVFNAILTQVTETKEKITLETQRSTIMLDSSDQIRVKVPKDLTPFL